MKNPLVKKESKKLIKEDIFDRFIDSVFDAYKRGIQKQFVSKTAEKYPELSKNLDSIYKNLTSLQNQLAKKKSNK